MCSRKPHINGPLASREVGSSLDLFPITNTNPYHPHRDVLPLNSTIALLFSYIGYVAGAELRTPTLSRAPLSRRHVHRTSKYLQDYRWWNGFWGMDRKQSFILTRQNLSNRLLIVDTRWASRVHPNTRHMANMFCKSLLLLSRWIGLLCTVRRGLPEVNALP